MAGDAAAVVVQAVTTMSQPSLKGTLFLDEQTYGAVKRMMAVILL